MKYDKNWLADRLDRIDKINFYKLDNIKIGSALSDMGQAKDETISYKSILKKYLLNIFEYNYSAKVEGNGNILFFYSNSNRIRPYVQQKMRNVAALTGNKISVEPAKRVLHAEYLFYMPLIIRWYKQLRHAGFTRKESLLFSIYIQESDLNLRELIKCVKEHMADINLLVSVHDNRMIDSVAIQYFRNIGKDTCTLQHGELLIDDLWLDAGKSFSKYFTVYGDLTYSRVINQMHHDNQVVKLGMPQMIGVEHKIKKGQSTGLFGVFLDFIAFEENNTLMIQFANEIAEKYGLNYFIKYHPSLDKKDYSNICSKSCVAYYRSEVSANDLVEKVDFAITSMSSMFGEILFQGTPVLRYINKSDMYEGIEQLKITCANDFAKYYSNGFNATFYDEMELVVDKICGKQNPKENYIRFLKRFES